MSKTVAFLGATLPLILFLFPNHTLALSVQQRYDVGWPNGISQAQYDWNNNLPYDPLCPAHHTDSFCLGFHGGYNHWWHSAQQQITQGSEQSASVNIRGNGDHVIVNQQSNDQLGSNGDDGDSSSGSGKQQLPKCLILCAAITLH
jgi:hypothetical protein